MGQPVSWYHKYKYRVEVDGITRAAFNKCSELEAEAADVKYKEGGRLHAHHAPGTVEFKEFTLERGACVDKELWMAWKRTYDAASGTGEDTPDLYFSGDVVQMNRKGKDVERYPFIDAYVRAYGSGNWDNDADEVRIEKITIQPDSFDRE